MLALPKKSNALMTEKERTTWNLTFSKLLELDIEPPKMKCLFWLMPKE